ncbi:MAG: rod shape-determining protein RodA [Muribaculaceae bacterium]|nr:rod shape-determining protein RodA [Muribaculaceae bacterium]
MRLLRRNPSEESIFKNLDWLTIILYLAMVCCGAVSIYAASYDFDQASMFSFAEFSGKQMRWILMALGIGLVLLLIETRIYETYAYLIYAVMILLLLVTPFVAPDIKGSRSWIVLGPMSLQPAEFAKSATALALARLFSGYNFKLNAKIGNYARALLIICLPILLILLQKETGSALVYLALFFVLYREGMSGLVLFAAAFAVTIFVVSIKYSEALVLGTPAGQFWLLVAIAFIILVMSGIYGKNRLEVCRNLLLGYIGCAAVIVILEAWAKVPVPGLPVMLGIIGAACAYLAFEAMRTRLPRLFVPVATAVLSVVFLFSVDMAFDKLQYHQQMRIKVVLGLEQDLRGAGYNVNQSKIAIGSGGLTGKGFLEGTQTKLKYVPEQHTDFIFCTIGEEEGFWGTTLVELMFIALILRIIHIAERQPTAFGRVYAYCVASYLIFHFCVNIGMVIGLCPVIGIPLPFFSYGGSSLWGFTILLFILLRIDASRKRVLSY